jgi:ferredoxin-NADP reductase
MPNPIKLRAVVDRIVSFGDGVYEVCFTSDREFARFKPGQFLHLTVDEYEPAGGFWPESRVFSIASSPGSDTLTIVYSVKGRYTKRMENYLAPGRQVWLKYPYGEFIIESNVRSGQDIVMVAGGTGISPYVAYLCKIADDGLLNGGTLRFYYGVRKPSLILFAYLLERCAEIKGLHICIFLEDGNPVRVPAKNVQLRKGKMDIEFIYADAAPHNDPVYFLSGPPTMIQSFRKKLEGLGVVERNIRVDEWE